MFRRCPEISELEQIIHCKIIIQIYPFIRLLTTPTHLSTAGNRAGADLADVPAAAPGEADHRL